MILLEGMFRLTLSLTLAGSLGVLLVAAGKAALKGRLSPGWSCRLWSLPLTLFLIPFALPVGKAISSPQSSLNAPAPPEAVLPAAQGIPGAATLPAGETWAQALPVLAWAWLLGDRKSVV